MNKNIQELREQERTLNLMHPHHICHLESTVCQLYSQLGEVKRICENKVQDLEKQFYLAHSETAEAQTGSTQNSKLRTRVISQTRNMGRGSPMQSVKDEKEARICEMEAKLSKLELEKVQLVSTCTKRLQALNDAKLEKDDLCRNSGLASLQFAECQCIVQCQEQEAMRLQHTLDVRELQGPGYSSASASGKLQHSVPRSHLLSAVWPHALHLPSSAPQVFSLVSTSKPIGGHNFSAHGTSEPTSKRLQDKMESLQNLVESSQIKNQATSPMIRTQEVKTKKCKEKERKLFK
ncbi:LOW QUALITY PROTEIN: coiled-coil domain-containing protein 158 [Ammospiza maritima maritima]